MGPVPSRRRFIFCDQSGRHAGVAGAAAFQAIKRQSGGDEGEQLKALMDADV